MINRVVLVGRMTRDPELRSTSTGRNVCQFSIAVNRNFTNANGEREADLLPGSVARRISAPRPHHRFDDERQNV